MYQSNRLTASLRSLSDSSPCVLMRVSLGLCAISWYASLASAVILPWGNLDTNSGPPAYDWEVQKWIDKYFEDGSKGDGEVTTDIAMYYTQCYGGDWLENFNTVLHETAGIWIGLYDNVRFTDATVHSANEAGKVAYVGGYHDHIAAVFQPFNLTTEPDAIEQIPAVHRTGVNLKDSREVPQSQGRNKFLQGNGDTHVLIYAGNPEPWEPPQILQKIEANYNAYPATNVTILAGDGSAAYADGPGTKAALKETLASIGAQINDHSQFVFHVADHGGLTLANVEPPTIVQPHGFNELLTANLDDLFVGQLEPIPPHGLKASATLATTSFLEPFELRELMVTVEHMPEGFVSTVPLADLEIGETEVLLGDNEVLPAASFYLSLEEWELPTYGEVIVSVSNPLDRAVEFNLATFQASVPLIDQPVTRPGDFDLDGDVDGIDFLKWQRGESPNPLNPDDLAAWSENYGVPPLVARSAPVPEPSTLFVLGLCLSPIVFSRREIILDVAN